MFANKFLDMPLRRVLNGCKHYIPTADVVEMKHGEWGKVRVVSEEYGFVEVYYQHKDCKISPTELYRSPYEYCPRCGAKMDGGKADNE